MSREFFWKKVTKRETKFRTVRKNVTPAPTFEKDTFSNRGYEFTAT